MPDGPGLVEAVDEGAVGVGLPPLLDVAAHAEVAVADGEQVSVTPRSSGLYQDSASSTGRRGTGSGRACGWRREASQLSLGEGVPSTVPARGGERGQSSSSSSSTTTSAPAVSSASAPDPAVDADHEPEVARPSGRDARRRVLEHDGASAVTPRRSAAPGRCPARACRPGPRARRPRRRRPPRTDRRARPPAAPRARCATTRPPPPSCRARRGRPGADRAGVRPPRPPWRGSAANSAFLRLPSPQRSRPRRVVRGALGQRDAAGGEERPHAVVAGLAVDVLEVVGVGVGLGDAALGEVAVEQALPGAHVHLGGRV